MSLAQAVLSIAEEMDKLVEGDSPLLSIHLKSFARELKTAVIAADTEGTVSRPSVMPSDVALEKARLAKKKQRVEQEELLATPLVRMEGGGMDGTLIPLTNKAPVGCKVPGENGEVYVLRGDRVLVYSEEETTKYRQALEEARKS